MPELPEVTTITNQLNQYLNNQTLHSITIQHNFEKNMGTHFNTFKADLPLKIDKVFNKGKYIFFIFKDKNWGIVNHLKMTGSWVTDPNKTKNTYIHVIFNLDNNKKLYFSDYRRFGSFDFLKQDKLQTIINNIMPSIFDNITLTQFKKNINTKKNSRIYTLLMKQKKSEGAIISGVGNYIANEALYEAQISPHRLVKDMSDTDIDNLFGAIHDICWNSYKSQGASVKDYINLEGNPGTYHFAFKVYGQKNDPLGNTVTRETIGGRTVHWVKKIQT